MAVSSRVWPSRWAVFALLSFLILILSVEIVPHWHAVYAQDGGEAAASDEGQGESTNIFRHIIKSAFEIKSGAFIFGMMLVFTSIGLFALIVLLAMDLRMTTCIPPVFVEEFTDTVNKRRFKEAFDLARNDTSFLGDFSMVWTMLARRRSIPWKASSPARINSSLTWRPSARWGP